MTSGTNRKEGAGMMEGRIENNGKSLWRARCKLRRALLCLAAAIFLWAQTGAALAATTYTVTNTNDSGAGSLRAALASVNLAGGDTIEFAAALAGQTITLDSSINYTTESLTFSVLGGGTVTITAGAGNTGGLLRNSGSGTIVFNNTLDFFSGLVVAAGSSANITLADFRTVRRVVLGASGAGNQYAGNFSGKLIMNAFGSYILPAGGGLYANNSAGLSILPGSSINGYVLFNSGSSSSWISAQGGGAYIADDLTSFAGTISNNRAGSYNGGSAANSYSDAYGGGLWVGGFIPDFSGTVNGNEASARIILGSHADAQASASGGGVLSGRITNLSGSITSNQANARSEGAGKAYASGGGLYVNLVDHFTGAISNNSATAVNTGSGSAYAYGGAVYGRLASGSSEFSGDMIGNTAQATVTIPAEAVAIGGAVCTWGTTGLTITGGEYKDNKAVVSGGFVNMAEGGAWFIDTQMGSGAGLTFDPKARAITFSGNKVVVGSVERSNALHFGRAGLSGTSNLDASLTIKDSLATNNLITIADGISTNINNGKTFTLAQSGGNFLWGGPNQFNSEGGDSVTLSGGLMRLANGFTLNRGYDGWAGTGPLAFTVSGGNLKSEGAATSLKHTALSLASGGKLTVDQGSTLTLDANSTFALNGGTLSIGVGASNTSGLIDMTANTTAAPTFNGSNTLDISTWIAGGYTVLKAGTAMDIGAPGTFSAFTVGGNALGVGMNITPTLTNGGKDLLVTASLGRDNEELTWGGASGTWNYSNTNWTLSGGIANFLPKDAALFDGAGAASQAVTLGGTSIDLSGLRVAGAADYTLSGAALRIDSTGAQGAAIAGLSYKDKLVKDGWGTLTLATGSAANPNLINTVEINGGTLTLGDGFALAPISGRGSLMGNGGTLALAGTAYLTNIDAYLVNAFSLVSGNTLVLADSSLDRNTVGLNVGSGATLASAGSSNTFSGNALNLNGGALDMRGNSVFTLNAALAGTGGTTRFNAGDSQIRLASGGNLGSGVMDVDLNRSKTLAAIDVTGGSLALADSTLRLRYTGNGAADGSWLIVNGQYVDYEGNAGGSGKSFQSLDIVTATLDGILRNDPTQIWFDGTYTPLTPGGITGLERLSPNARNMAPGLLERIEYGRGPAYEYLYSLSGDTFNNAVLGVLPYASAEGAVSQGIQALSAHNAAAMAAFGYAFGPDALESAQSFAPLAFQAPNTLGLNMGSQSRRDQARATARQADRMASLDGDMGYGHSTYSILGNWTPALDSTRNLVASASPEYTLNAAGPNTAFGARIWGGYLGNFAHQDNKGGYAGYDADQNGFLLGGSFDLGQSWTVGAYAGWTTGSTRYNDIKTRIDTDATHVGAFARYKRELGPGTAKVTGDILYSFTDNDSRRTVPLGGPLGDQRMKGSFDQNIIGGGLEAAYDWKPGFDEALVITPYLAGRYAHLEQDGFTESGSLGLKVGKTDADSFTTTVGVKAARDFNVSDSVILTPRATVGWLHQWADRDVSANSSFISSPVTFMTRSVKQDADAALVGAGLDVLVKTGKSWDLGLKLGYGADIRANSNDQTVFAGFEIKF